jgi:hypothetical protein
MAGGLAAVDVAIYSTFATSLVLRDDDPAIRMQNVFTDRKNSDRTRSPSCGPLPMSTNIFGSRRTLTNDQNGEVRTGRPRDRCEFDSPAGPILVACSSTVGSTRAARQRKGSWRKLIVFNTDVIRDSLALRIASRRKSPPCLTTNDYRSLNKRQN